MLLDVKGLRDAVIADRLRFISAVTDRDVHRPCLLAPTHQVFMCLTKELFPDQYWSIITKYAEDPLARMKLWAALYAAYSDVGTANIYTDTSSLAQNFEAIVHGDAAKGAVSFSNKNGFAFFRGATPICDGVGISSFIVEGTAFTSCDALFYYGFNIGSNMYLQAGPIECLADTCLLYTEGKVKVPDRESFYLQSMRAELMQMADTGEVKADILTGLNEFLLKHEYGHHLEYAGNSPVRCLLEEEELSLDAFYDARFPTEEDLGAWRRVKSGQGKPSDVLFLLGDYIANMAALCEGLEHSFALPLLRSFNWWLVRPRSESCPPRGTPNFLIHSYSYNLEAYINDLGELLRTARDKPANLEAMMQTFEQNSRKSLLNLTTQAFISPEIRGSHL